MHTYVTLSVKQLEGEFAAYGGELALLVPDKDTEIEQMRTQAIAQFKIRVEVRHEEDTRINTLLLHKRKQAAHRIKQEKRRFVSHIPTEIVT